MAALLCQHVDRRPEGATDILGVIDGLVVAPTDTESDPLGVKPMALLPLRALIILRAGTERGWHALGLQGIFPGGQPGPAMRTRIEFTDDRPGATINIPVDLEVHHEGMYEFEVTYDGRVLTRMSLQVVVGE